VANPKTPKDVIAMAKEAGGKNWSFGAKGTEISDQDITFGWIDLTSPTSPIDTSVSPAQYNAVQVITRTIDPQLDWLLKPGDAKRPLPADPRREMSLYVLAHGMTGDSALLIQFAPVHNVLFHIGQCGPILFLQDLEKAVTRSGFLFRLPQLTPHILLLSIF